MRGKEHFCFDQNKTGLVVYLELLSWAIVLIWHWLAKVLSARTLWELIEISGLIQGPVDAEQLSDFVFERDYLLFVCFCHSFLKDFIIIINIIDYYGTNLLGMDIQCLHKQFFFKCGSRKPGLIKLREGLQIFVH